jgi:hypothetical protein
MLHDQGFERELRKRVCHLLVTDHFEEQLHLISGGRRMYNDGCRSTADM